MKLGALRMVNRHAEARDQLRRQMRGKIEVYIDGVRQDDEVSEAARVPVQRVLDLRLDEVERDLEGLGVDLD